MKARIGLPLSEPLPPDQIRSPRSPSPAQPETTMPKPATAPKNYVVQKGDSLYSISRKFYGDSSHIDRIYQANRDVMRSKKQPAGWAGLEDSSSSLKLMVFGGP